MNRSLFKVCKRWHPNQATLHRRFLPVLATLLAAGIAADLALAQGTPKSLLAQTASISSNGADGATAGELVRLPLSLDVLEACQSDLSDLRLFSGDTELPFFVQRAPLSPEALKTRIVPRFGSEVAQGASGGRVSNQLTTLQSETYVVTAPPFDPAQSKEGVGEIVWHLRLEVPRNRGSFTRRLQLSWQDASGARTPIYDGSIFRLNSDRERLSVRLPIPTSDFLAIELSGESNEQRLAPLEPLIVYERILELGEHANNPQPANLRVEVSLSAPEEQDGRATYAFELPPGLIPDGFEIITSTGNFERQGRILGTVPGRPEPRLLGSALLRRLSAAQASITSDLVIPTADTHASAFELQIDGGASTALADLRVIALVRQPELLFEWPATSNKVDLLFGGGRIARATFDLEALLKRQVGVVSEAKAEVVTSLNQAALPVVHLGPITANNTFDPAPLLSFLQRSGAQLVPGQFRYRTALQLADGATGLHRINLGPQILERLRKDLGDLRFADSNGQWPYLIESSDDWQRPLEVASSAVKDQPRKSRFTLSLDSTSTSQATDELNPDSALRTKHITLLIDAPFFDRPYTLNTIDTSGKSRTVHTGRLVASDARSAFYSFYRNASKQRSFDLHIAPQAARQYELIVENGDDAPLPLIEASASGAGWQALLVAPEGEYEAFFGELVANKIPAPSYEITRAGSLIRSMRGARLEILNATGNPKASPPGLSQLPWQNILLWLAIGLSVIGLAWVTLRSVKTS